MRRRWTFTKIGILHGFALESRADRGIHHQFGQAERRLIQSVDCGAHLPWIVLQSGGFQLPFAQPDLFALRRGKLLECRALLTFLQCG